MSTVLGVSRSGYYKWASRGPSQRATQNNQFSRHIRRIWASSGRTYGSPRIHKQLQAEGHSISRPRVARLMKAAGIQSHIRPKWIATTHSSHSLPVAPNLLDRNFSPAGLGQIWVSDITYLPSIAGWLYLTTFMDLADRQVLGWTLAEGMKADQTSVPALKQAIARRCPDNQTLIHSDQGLQYACTDFTDLLGSHGLTQSMSRKGNCWDNAPAESFFKTFKAELPIDCRKSNYGQIRRAVFDFIERWYNRQRLHSTLDYRTPVQMEKYLIEQQQSAA